MKNLPIADLKSLLYSQSKEVGGSVFYFGRSGNYPGYEWINLFDLGPLVYVQIYRELNPPETEEIKGLLFELFPGKALSIVSRASIPPEMIYLSNEITEDHIYTENELKFYLNFRRPSHPGLFFDIEPARKWVLTNSANKRVLNLFAFTCGFSVYAAAGGACSILNIDNNSNVLSRGRNNHRLNKQDLSNIRFEKKDVLKNFGYFDKKGPFDLIICDPPSRQKNSFSAARDYPKLVRRLKATLAKEGTMLLCLNDPFLDFSFLEKIVKDEGLTLTRRIEPAEPFIQKDPLKGLKILCVQGPK